MRHILGCGSQTGFYRLSGILPLLEYAGFMLVACNIEDRRDLQKCQNDALRTCTTVRLNDHVRIEDLHARCKLVSLEQRRRIQLPLLCLGQITMKELCISEVPTSKDVNFGIIWPLKILNFLTYLLSRLDLKD